MRSIEDRSIDGLIKIKDPMGDGRDDVDGG